MIAGVKVRIRSLEKQDLEQCKKWVNDPQIARELMRVLPVSMHEHILWYEKIIADQSKVTFAIETLGEKKYIETLA